MARPGAMARPEYGGFFGIGLTTSYPGLLTNIAKLNGPGGSGGRPMKASLIRFWLANSGATAVEYAMIAGGIALVIVASVNTLGTTVDGLFVSAVAALK
jgi:pilus assembly protein Flp/PilA